MLYRVFGGLAFIALGLIGTGWLPVPAIVTGILCIVAGVALLAGK